MATWDAADLLSRFNLVTDAPSNDSSITPAQIYALLSSAQQRVYRIFAMHGIATLWESPTTMTSSDGGSTYTFPNGDYPLQAELRDGVNGPILYGGADFAGIADYVLEGNQIRIPSGQSRTFSNGLSVRYIKTPADISASQNPTLQPDYARELIVWSAAEEWASLGGLDDPAPYARMFQVKAWGDPNTPGDPGIIGALKKQVHGGAYGVGAAWGAQSPATAWLWWRNMGGAG